MKKHFLSGCIGLLFSTYAFSSGYLDEIKALVDEEKWNKIPVVTIKKSNESDLELDYPGFSPSELPEGGMMLFTLPSGRKGLAFRYDIVEPDQLASLYRGGKIKVKNKAVVESIFQRYTDSEYNFAPSGGITQYLGTSGGCGNDTVLRVAELINFGSLITKDRRVIVVQ